MEKVGGQKREIKGVGQRMTGKRGEKREEDSKLDGGPMPADAAELMLCSIHCVMAASSYKSQSQYSCHLWTDPLQMVKMVIKASRGSH